MAISKMLKIIIVSHHSEDTELLQAIQEAGLMQVLDAERAMVTKHWPELCLEASRHKDIEETILKLDTAVKFTEKYIDKKDTPPVLSPLSEVDRNKYQEVVTGKKAYQLLNDTIECKNEMENVLAEIARCKSLLNNLEPWQNLKADIKDIRSLNKANVIAGTVSVRKWQQLIDELDKVGAAVEVVDQSKTHNACLIACLKEKTVETGKILRAFDFETFNFDLKKGTVKDNITQIAADVQKLVFKLGELREKARNLTANRLDLQILSDYYDNLHNRENTKGSCPATDHTVIFEGWVKEKDYGKLSDIVAGFSSSSINQIESQPDEDVPVEIDNNKFTKPFETITRLHGMPNYKAGDVDPTAFLAPFFALFFGLCLTDAGYGIIMTIASWWLIKKIQGDKKAIWMLLICSLMTIAAGAITGSWFGDTFEKLIPANTAVYQALNGFRTKLMLFDPMKDPMSFFMLSVGLGYVQIMFALFIGLFNNIMRKDYATAVFNFLVWIVFLNSLVVFGVSKAGMAPAVVGKIAGWIAVVQTVLIFWFSERNSGLAGRIGGGVFSLFSTVFYFGDILSYVRLMALGMVTAGLGMAVNILVQLLMDIPYVGFILGAMLFVTGHLLNMVLSILSSFVHSLRLQFVEFFPKFFTGGGTEFKPLTMNYKYLMMKNNR